MSVSGKSILAVCAGLIIGWGSRAYVTRTGDGLEASGQVARGFVRSVAKPSLRPNTSFIHDRSDVQACRSLWESSGSRDQRHPLLRKSDPDRELGSV